MLDRIILCLNPEIVLDPDKSEKYFLNMMYVLFLISWLVKLSFENLIMVINSPIVSMKLK